jgi:hypothetical protein
MKKTLYELLGGRKMANGYLAALLLTIGFYFVARSAGAEAYRWYGLYLLVALGITTIAVAWEDIRRGA